MMRLPGIISCLFVFGASGQGIYYDNAPQQSGASYSQRGLNHPHQQQHAHQVPNRGQVPPPVPFHGGSQQQTYQQPYQSAYHQPYPQSYQQPQKPRQNPEYMNQQIAQDIQNPWQNPDQYMTQQIAQDNQYLQPLKQGADQYMYLQPRKQDADEDTLYPQGMRDGGSLEPGMTVAARFSIDFGDVVIEQGTKGQIVSRRGHPLLVKWEGIGDRPVAPSQLIPIGPDPADSEEVYYPKVMRPNREVQAPVEEDNTEKPTKPSLAGTEENKAEQALAADETTKQAPSGTGKGKRMGKGKKGKAKADPEAGVTV